MDWKKYSINYKELSFKKVLGKGAQANVYEADLNGQRVAVKKFSVFQQPDFDLIARLNHKNVIRLLGVDIDHNCVVMEICQKSLYDIIQSEVHIKFLEFLNWTKQIAEGMEYLHSENVTHRDLKSPNVLLGLDGGIKICDFDLSKISPTATLLMTSLCGTLHWVAPEILREEPYTRKVDVWSFGIVAWELVTQQLPYNGEVNYPIKLSMNKIRPRFPFEIHPLLLQLFEACLDFDHVKRPEFSFIREKLHAVPKIEDLNWTTWKRSWKTTKFDSSVVSFSQSDTSETRSTSAIKNGEKTQTFEQRKPSRIVAVTEPAASGGIKANLQMLACNLANVQLNIVNITAETNRGRTCRNRIHILSKYSGSTSNCDLCKKSSAEKIQICTGCQMVCHATCNDNASTEKVCVARPKKVFDVKNEEKFVKLSLSDRLPPTQPQIFHHIVHCIFELERRKRIFAWNKELEIAKQSMDNRKTCLDLILKFYNRPFPPKLSDLSDGILQMAIDRFWMPKLPLKQTDVFLKSLRGDAIDEIKQFITDLEPCRKCTTALLFTHWKLKKVDVEIDESTIHAVTVRWIGVETPDNLRTQLKTLMLCIDFDFWKQFLVCQ